MATAKNEQQFAKLIFVIGGLKMNLVRVKNNDIKVIERHPVKVLGNDYRVKIVYKNVKIAMLDVEDDTIKLTLQNKYKKMNNTQMLDLAIEKMYESIAKVEIERAMEKTRIMLGFAPEDYKIEKLKNDFGKCDGKNIIIDPTVVMYKREIIDYIVLHQYCHLKYKTHAKGFYKILEKYCPNYEKYEKVLNF